MTASVPSAPDTTRLYAAARYHARAAVALQQQPWAEHAALDVATRAGAVVELLSKTFLLHQDKRLVAKASHDHLLELVAQARGLTVPTPKAGGATVDARIAVEMVSKLDANIAVHASAARDVLNARNKAVHMAIASDEQRLADVVTAMGAFANSIVSALKLDVATFWGEYTSAVAQRIRDHEQEVRLSAKAAVDAARERYEQRRNAFADQDTWSKVLELLQEGEPGPPEGELEASVTCPVCESEATVEWETDVDAEGDHGEVTYFQYHVLLGLTCPVCGLTLDGEQLEALQLPDLPDLEEVLESAYEAFPDRLGDY